MFRVKVQWQEGPVWQSVMAKVTVSRKGNFTVKHDGKVYVFNEKREGAPVLVLNSGEWVKAGRVTRGSIFLGPGISSSEHYSSPEGIRSAQEALNSFLAARQVREERSRSVDPAC
jgi:hypothetical protein